MRGRAPVTGPSSYRCNRRRETALYRYDFRPSAAERTKSRELIGVYSTRRVYKYALLAQHAATPPRVKTRDSRNRGIRVRCARMYDVGERGGTYGLARPLNAKRRSEEKFGEVAEAWNDKETRCVVALGSRGRQGGRRPEKRVEAALRKRRDLSRREKPAQTMRHSIGFEGYRRNKCSAV